MLTIRNWRPPNCSNWGKMNCNSIDQQNLVAGSARTPWEHSNREMCNWGFSELEREIHGKREEEYIKPTDSSEKLGKYFNNLNSGFYASHLELVLCSFVEDLRKEIGKKMQRRKRWMIMVVVGFVCVAERKMEWVRKKEWEIVILVWLEKLQLILLFGPTDTAAFFGLNQNQLLPTWEFWGVENVWI